MKEEILRKISIAMRALNNVSVHGKSNLDNLSGSIAFLEEIRRMVEVSDVVERQESNKD